MQDTLAHLHSCAVSEEETRSEATLYTLVYNIFTAAASKVLEDTF